MSNNNNNLNAYGIRLEVLKNAKEMVWDAWHQETDEVKNRAVLENAPYDLPPLPTTQDVLTTASEFYNFVQNHGKNS